MIVQAAEDDDKVVQVKRPRLQKPLNAQSTTQPPRPDLSTDPNSTATAVPTASNDPAARTFAQPTPTTQNQPIPLQKPASLSETTMYAAKSLFRGPSHPDLDIPRDVTMYDHGVIPHHLAPDNGFDEDSEKAPSACTYLLNLLAGFKTQGFISSVTIRGRGV